MKIKTCLWFSLFLGVVVSLPAQTLFSDLLVPPNTNWSSSPANQGGGDLAFFASGPLGGLGYTVVTPTATDTGYRTLTVFAAPPTSNWSAQVDVHLATLGGLTPGQFANLNLVIAKTADGSNFNTSLALDRYNSGAGVVHDVDTFVATAGVSTHLSEVLDTTADATLLVSYDSASQLLMYRYDPDGPANGAVFSQIHTVGIAAWAMGPSDSFSFLLVGGSGSMTGGTGPTLAMTDAYFQNFSFNGLAVP